MLISSINDLNEVVTSRIMVFPLVVNCAVSFYWKFEVYADGLIITAAFL